MSWLVPSEERDRHGKRTKDREECFSKRDIKIYQEPACQLIFNTSSLNRRPADLI